MLLNATTESVRAFLAAAASPAPVLASFWEDTDLSSDDIGLATDGDLSTAIAISDGTDPWDAGGHDPSVVTPIGKKTTGARAVVMTVAGGQDLTAGKITFAIGYWVGA